MALREMTQVEADLRALGIEEDEKIKWWPVWLILGVGIVGVAASIIAPWIGK